MRAGRRAAATELRRGSALPNPQFGNEEARHRAEWKMEDGKLKMAEDRPWTHPPCEVRPSGRLRLALSLRLSRSLVRFQVQLGNESAETKSSATPAGVDRMIS